MTYSIRYIYESQKEALDEVRGYSDIKDAPIELLNKAAFYPPDGLMDMARWHLCAALDNEGDHLARKEIDSRGLDVVCNDMDVFKPIEVAFKDRHYQVVDKASCIQWRASVHMDFGMVRVNLVNEGDPIDYINRIVKNPVIMPNELFNTNSWKSKE